MLGYDGACHSQAGLAQGAHLEGLRVLAVHDRLPKGQAALLHQIQQQSSLPGVFPGQVPQTGQKAPGQGSGGACVALSGRSGQGGDLRGGQGRLLQPLRQGQAQGIVLPQVLPSASAFGQLPLQGEALGGLTGDGGLGQVAGIQKNVPLPQQSHGVLQLLLARLGQLCQEMGGGQGASRAQGGQAPLPGALL